MSRRGLDPIALSVSGVSRVSTALTILMALTVILATGAGCATRSVKAPIPIVRAQGDVPEHLLLDVGIQLFDAGIPEADAEDVLINVRKAEARFVPYHFKAALQESGYWGAIRLTPESSRGSDVSVSGEILESDGHVLELAVGVADATGRTWIDRRYRAKADASSYAAGPRNSEDPFQKLYNQIANDMLEARAQLSADEVQQIRRVATLRFAADLAPDSFAQHLQVHRDGRTTVLRLPADDDPIFAHVERIRARDHLLVDTLNEHYADFYVGMEVPYRKWRAFSQEEQAVLRKVKRDSNIRLAAGAVSMIGGMLLAQIGGPLLIELLSLPLIAGGTMAVQNGWELRFESEIHAEAVRELGVSFDADVEPRVIEVEGRTLRLTGSAETQYQNWRRMLREIYRAEVGFVEEPAIEDAPASGKAFAH